MRVNRGFSWSAGVWVWYNLYSTTAHFKFKAPKIVCIILYLSFSLTWMVDGWEVGGGNVVAYFKGRQDRNYAQWIISFGKTVICFFIAMCSMTVIFFGVTTYVLVMFKIWIIIMQRYVYVAMLSCMAKWKFQWIARLMVVLYCFCATKTIQSCLTFIMHARVWVGNGLE